MRLKGGDPSIFGCSSRRSRGHRQRVRQPCICFVATGDALSEPSRANFSNRIPESISHSVAAFVAQWGSRTVASQILPDEPTMIANAAREALATADVIVLIVGAFKDSSDFAKAAMQPLGLIFTRPRNCWVSGMWLAPHAMPFLERHADGLSTRGEAERLMTKNRCAVSVCRSGWMFGLVYFSPFLLLARKGPTSRTLICIQIKSD